jgi:glycosyltransferase involved in cell wall biosynthesis
MSKSYSVHHITSFIVEKQVSGHSYSVPALCEALSNDIETHLHTTKPHNLLNNPSFKLHEYEINKIFKFALSSRAFKKGMKDKVKDGDIIHNHMLWRMPNIYPLNIQKFKKINHILSPRGTMSKDALDTNKNKKSIFNLISNQNNMLSSCDAFHATSIKEKDEIRELGFKQPIAIIPNGIKIPSFTKKIYSNNKFLYLGRIHPIKGLELLINTWKKIDDNKTILDICGYYEDKKYYNSLKNLVKKLGISNIIFSDTVIGESKKNKFLENDIFILPSKTENFGLVVAEALSYGLPVIVSENTPWKAVKDRKCGWTINLNERNIISIINFTKTLSTKTLKNMGNNGRIFVKNKYSWDKLYTKYIDFYSWLNGGGETPEFVDLF